MPETNDRLAKAAEVGRVFTPATPVNTRELFAGRVPQLQKSVDGITELGRHIVLYGERGVGKTSLANILREIVEEHIYLAKATLDTTDNFQTAWHKIFGKITSSIPKERIGFLKEIDSTDVNLGRLVPPGSTPGDIVTLLEKIGTSVVLIMDEYDRVRDSQTKQLLAETLKALSDNVPSATVVLVGVARNIGELLGQHASVQRNLKEVEVPRMDKTEMIEIIDKGLSRLQINMTPETKEKIVDFAAGFPHYVHLLARHSCEYAVETGADTVEVRHFDNAVGDALADANEAIRDAYQKATIATKKTRFEPVLRACAVVPKDEYGTFRPTDLEPVLSKIEGRNLKVVHFIYTLGKLCSLERGNILEKVGIRRRYRYRFTDPLMEAYIRLRAYRSNQLQ